MRILYFTQYYPPEVGATQTRAHEMCGYLASHGHRVTVVTEVPNHPSGIIPPRYKHKLWERKREDGIDVLRLWVWASPEKNFRSRMRFYLSYMAVAALAGSLLRGRYSLVYATSPPLFVGGAGLFTSLARRIPLVFEVRDLWPESAVALGELNNKRAISAAEKLEEALYRRAVHVVSVTQGIETRLRARGVPANKIAYIPNGANVEHFQFSLEGRRRVRRELHIPDEASLVMYAGIHGVAQGLETLLQAADLLRERDDILFALLGEGPRKAQIEALASRMELPNLRLLPEVPSVAMPSYLSAADCMVVPLRDEPIFKGALPSKMFEAWACERPVVLSVTGEAAQLLEQAQGGISIPPEDPQAMSDAIKYMAEHRSEAQAMGRSARLYVALHYSRETQAEKLETLLLGLLNKKAR
ncbi:MAG: glycosyltransferase family 4 protein [Chloroflexota bacterium]|nr:glycosyltransferase family 4 protein [Chloroflexota bacterium]